MSLSYKSSGVNVEAGDQLVSWLQDELAPGQKSANSQATLSGVGGFAALTRLPLQNYKKPLLVTSTDGVGTKLLLASHWKRYEGIGQDLVAMCANDLITCGGDPLFFLDYYATGKLDLDQAKQFLKGLQAACVKVGCSLIGGETAEMPGLYAKGHFDCAGFIIGMVDEDQRLGSHRVQPNDKLIGISSSGFHSNGYSWLRKIFEGDLDHWKEELLKPTALYHEVVKKLRSESGVHAFAHITGGGMENIPRVLPDGTFVKLKKWKIPDPFLEVQKRSGVSSEELLKSLNCGVGFVGIVSPDSAKNCIQSIEELGFQTFDLGRVEMAKDNKLAEASMDYQEWA